MDRRFEASALLVCCLAILIGSVKPDSLPGELLSDGSLDFDPLITEWPSLAGIKTYEFYKISMRWPKSACSGAAGCLTPAYFTIHGLWPHYKPDNEVPPFNPTNSDRCTNVEPALDTSITATSLASILSDMNRYWPSLTNPTTAHNLEFWHHEWNKHGKCWDRPKQPIAYFRRALNFARQNSLVDILRKACIVPDDSKRYNRNDIANAVKNGLDKVPEIKCNPSNQLMEIRVCYDHDNHRTDCPTGFKDCNSQQLAFPKP